MDYKQLTELHLGAVLYRIEVERICKQNGTWLANAPLIMCVELTRHAMRLRGGDATAAMRSRVIVELAREYVQSTADKGGARVLANRLDVDARRAIDVVSQRMRETPTLVPQLRTTVETLAKIQISVTKLLRGGAS